MDAGGAGPAAAEIGAVESVQLVLALVGVAFALCVVTLHPELGCAAIHGMLLFLSAGAKGAAATVAAFTPDPLMQLVATAYASFANGVSIVACFHLVSVVAVFAFDRCHGHLLAHMAMFIAHVLLLTRGIALFFPLD